MKRQWYLQDFNQPTSGGNPAQLNQGNIMKSNRLTVAEGIMDTAAEEYRSENLASVDSVMDYADGLDVDITQTEAKQVLSVCQRMQSRLDAGEIPTTGAWYHDFEKPLSQTI